MSDFIKVYERNKKLSQGIQGTLIDSMSGKVLQFKTIGVLDSGCQITAIPFRSIVKNCTEEDLRRYKRIAIQAYRAGHLEATHSRGVESSHLEARPDFSALSDEELEKLGRLSFIYTIKDFSIGGYCIGDIKAKINFDRDHPPLIGMNVIEMLERHAGESRMNGKDIFIACRKDDINSGFLEELRKHLGYVPEECLYSKVLISSLRATFMKKFTSIIKPSKPEDLF